MKVNFDDNALFKHPEIADLRDLSEEDPIEIEASKHDLSYIKLDGSIGCMVNGAETQSFSERRFVARRGVCAGGVLGTHRPRAAWAVGVGPRVYRRGHGSEEQGAHEHDES